MRFNVAQLLKEGVGSRRSYSLDETLEALPETGTTRVWGNITLTRIDRGIWVSGPIETNATGPCGRCLNICEHWICFHIDEEYLPTVEIGTGTPVRMLDVKEGAFTLNSHHILDLAEAIRQYTIINLPMKPLCRFNCAGLCSACGTNLNDRPCACSTYSDSRWGLLLGLLAAQGKG